MLRDQVEEIRQLVAPSFPKVDGGTGRIRLSRSMAPMREVVSTL